MDKIQPSSMYGKFANSDREICGGVRMKEITMKISEDEQFLIEQSLKIMKMKYIALSAKYKHMGKDRISELLLENAQNLSDLCDRFHEAFKTRREV